MQTFELTFDSKTLFYMDNLCANKIISLFHIELTEIRDSV